VRQENAGNNNKAEQNMGLAMHTMLEKKDVLNVR